MVKQNLKKVVKEQCEEISLLCKQVDSIKHTSDTKTIFLVILLLALIGSSCLFLTLNKDINEKRFCLGKLNEIFPEYDFQEAFYHGLTANKQYSCRGYYYEGEEEMVRDGLKEITNKEKLHKDFKLLDRTEIALLESDNLDMVIQGIGIALLIISGLIFLVWIIIESDIGGY